MNDNNQIIIYQTEDGQTQVDVRMENDTVWLTQAQMAELFDKDQSVIARHIANVFKEGELEKESNMQILHKFKLNDVHFFCTFMERNGILYGENGRKRIPTILWWHLH